MNEGALGPDPSADPTIGDAGSWALDREIVLVRVFDASRESVFAAWTDAEAFCQWFGPSGFTCEVREMDVRPGGRACFDMVSGDGTLYTNRFDYIEVIPGQRLIMDHGPDLDDDPTRFRVTLTFDEQSDGKTVLTLRQLHPTVEQRNAGIGFGAVELGLQTMDKLSQYLKTSAIPT
ncbi:MAG: SRPBCC family protein [Microthrixaceae bacterium]